jgi:predicted ribosomally synthesized peptide with nif11-like leader
MSLQNALQFIKRVREDETLKRRIEALGRAAGLEELAQIGAEAGMTFTAEELQQAFKNDWAMRRLYYDTRPTTQEPE